jgi:hypothetical protein
MVRVPRVPMAPRWFQDFVARLQSELNGVQPVRLPNFTTAKLPDAEAYIYCAVYNTTINRICVSDGTNWIRQDTGATV